MRNNDHALKKSTFLLLHISLLFSSLSGVCSKKASGYTDHIFSLPVIVWFGLVCVIMFGYAIIWQQPERMVRIHEQSWNIRMSFASVGFYLVCISDHSEKSSR